MNCLGSLIVRVVFHPIEETLRLYFSRTLGINFKTQPSVQHTVDILHALLAIQMTFSMILLVFGSAYLPILLPLLLPRQYFSTSAPSVLSAWVWYIPVLAVNGGLEAFHSSVATPKDLNAQSRFVHPFRSSLFSFLSHSQVDDSFFGDFHPFCHFPISPPPRRCISGVREHNQPMRPDSLLPRFLEQIF